jgi:tetratricopeptide (TPR) repeat protein
MTEFTSRFQTVVNALAYSESQEADLLLLQIEPDEEHLMRMCAIPHTFDAGVLRVLNPELSSEEAEQAIEKFNELPAVLQHHDCLQLHDIVRHQLFLQWLSEENRSEFITLSSRLAAFFCSQDADTAAAVERQHSRLFHLIGAEPEKGFSDFQCYYQERREQSRFTECEALVQLVGEYRTVLSPHHAAWLRYYEAEILDDNRDWSDAIQHFELLLQDELPADLRSKALLRLASTLRKLKRFDEADIKCLECLDLAEGLDSGGAPLHLIHHERGIVARDRGDFGEAQEQLKVALERAKAEGNSLDVAMVYNSLGTLLLKTMPTEAVAAFEECLKILDPNRDGVRIAQVLNNVAVASANLGNWNRSEAAYERSLEIKRATADSYGLASTLLNVARVYRAQQEFTKAEDALVESAALFERVNDFSLAARSHLELARLADGRKLSASVGTHARRAIQLFDASSKAEDAEATRREFRIDRKFSWLPWIVCIVGALAVGTGTLILFIW